MRVRAELGIGNEPLIGMVARLHVLKGQRHFIDAAAIVSQHYPDARFALAGRGCDPSNPELARWIEERRLSEHVHLLGERADIRPIDSALDVAVCASISESFPNSIGEAMACGTPCVVTDVGDCNVLVGDTGVVVPPGDPAALAEGIQRLLALSPETRRALGVRATERVRGEFDMSTIAARFARLYDAVAPGSG